MLASTTVLAAILGFAAKDTVANFFAGIFLMADSPFKEGDYILLETVDIIVNASVLNNNPKAEMYVQSLTYLQNTYKFYSFNYFIKWNFIYIY